jgi:hypothetical protein
MDDYGNTIYAGRRVLREFNPNFVIGAMWVVAVLVVGSILVVHNYVLPSYTVSISKHTIDMILVGEYSQASHANHASIVDRQSGGAGYVHQLGDDLYRVYSSIDDVHDDIDRNVASIDVPQLDLWTDDMDVAREVSQLLATPMDSVLAISNWLMQYNSHQISYGLLKYHISEYISQLYNVVKSSKLQQDTSLPYDQLNTLYNTIHASLQDVDLQVQQVSSNVKYWLIQTTLQVSQCYALIA